jgi:glycogen debranching enzyme
MADQVEEAAQRSRALLFSASTPSGFVASPDYEHYAVIWARDALISSLGALRSREDGLIETVASTLDTLTSHMSALGQVPTLVDPTKDTWDFGEGGVVDATAWLPVIVAEYWSVTGDLDGIRSWWGPVEAAIRWLAHQDVTGSGLLSVAPSTDWMDAALTRSGRTLHINVLYAWAIRSAERIADALGERFEPPVPDIAELVDAWFWPDPGRSVEELYPTGFAHTAIGNEYARLAATERGHYVSHIVHAAFVDVIDVQANSLAVLAGIAEEGRAGLIIESLESSSIPWPSRTFAEPIQPNDSAGMLIRAVDEVIDPRWSNTPGRYHNGAAWPYVGGLHAAAVAAHSGRTAALALLERLAAANALGDWRFSEWIGPDGPDGAPGQTWNAGTYLYAWSMIE